VIKITKNMRNILPKLIASEIVSVQPIASEWWCDFYNELKDEYNKTKHKKED